MQARALIVSRELPPGAKLPTTKEMAEKWKEAGCRTAGIISLREPQKPAAGRVVAAGAGFPRLFARFCAHHGLSTQDEWITSAFEMRLDIPGKLKLVLHKHKELDYLTYQVPQMKLWRNMITESLNLSAD